MTASRTRPTGISLIALIFLAEAIVALGLAAFLLLSTSSWSGLDSLFKRFQLPAALTSLIALPPLLTAGLAGLEFRGLWQQRQWARMAALVLVLLIALLAIAALAFLAAFDLAGAGVLGGLAGVLVLAAFTFFYLLRTSFGQDAEPIIADSYASPAPGPGYVERTPAASPPRPMQSQPGVYMDELVPPPRAPRPQFQYHEAETIASPAPVATATQQVAAPVPPAAWLVVRHGDQIGKTFELYADRPLTLGRDPAQSDGFINDPTVSGRHAQVRYENARFTLYDLGSTNGTFINGQPVQRQPLWDGIELRLGTTTLLFTSTRP